MNHLTNQFEEFMRRVAPDARDDQRASMQRAYFFGAKIVMEAIAKLQDQPTFVRQREFQALITEHKLAMLGLNAPTEQTLVN